MTIKTDKNGLKYYEELPPGWRQAQVDDFFDDTGRFIVNFAYLVKSNISGQYQCYRTITRAGFSNLRSWIHEGKVYIFG